MAHVAITCPGKREARRWWWRRGAQGARTRGDGYKQRREHPRIAGLFHFSYSLRGFCHPFGDVKGCRLSFSMLQFKACDEVAWGFRSGRGRPGQGRGPGNRQTVVARYSGKRCQRNGVNREQ